MPQVSPDVNAQAIDGLSVRIHGLEGKVVGLDKQVSRNSQSTAAVVAQIELQRESVAAFWSTHWPALLKRIDVGAEALVRLESRLADIDDRVDGLQVNMWKLIAAMAGSGVMGGGFTAALLEMFGKTT